MLHDIGGTQKELCFQVTLGLESSIVWEQHLESHSLTLAGNHEEDSEEDSVGNSQQDSKKAGSDQGASGWGGILVILQSASELVG